MSRQVSFLQPEAGVSESDIAVPLAHRMRPRTLSEVTGQDELTRPDSWFSAMLKEGRAISCIFWGAPGVGKTTLATMMADAAGVPFTHLSAVSAGKAEVQQVVRQAKEQGKTWLLFLDEIHRFNKAQQDVLLPYIEDGTLVLVGATTENPSFSLNNALLSRCRVIVLKSLQPSDIESILQRAATFLQQEAPMFNVESDALKWLAAGSDGDARYALNALEALYESDQKRSWDKDAVKAQGMRRAARYDRDGDSHYDLISALHKSVRDSDADASVYWLARMLEAGEEPLYIARRLIRMATEDIGLADPKALNVALDAHRMYEILGSPEGEQGLFETAIYLALAPKSNAAYMAEKRARRLARETQQTDVPTHLKNAPTRLMKELGHGAGYQYAHDAEDAVVTQQHFPEGVNAELYKPVDRGFERTLRERIHWLNERKGRGDKS
ncbi:Recombination protein MgsA [Mariprofundus ferrinatatus]|uniref:Replication-associated recombination protein A n=1 Tax=Mariprofundus ferrinatatus TaxID=1921087 RepID=A0A2K8L8G4_9PROT|nr:replication-associated recombination protein A [Mariprofundus ferrinatatus]ATX82161.1 Recombination protein MgsA [Mariprofundus ferrinatatus]